MQRIEPAALSLVTHAKRPGFRMLPGSAPEMWCEVGSGFKRIEGG
jgi:hypothetical protein